MSLLETVNIVYDGRCGLCLRCVRLMKRVGLKTRMSFYDANDRIGFESRFPVLKNADVDAAMYVVDESERVYRGYYAIRRILWIAPLLWILLPWFYFPGVAPAGEYVYAWVARNRRQFGCQSDSCALNGNKSAASTRPGNSPSKSQ